MTKTKIDARSKPCPQPVIETRQALDDPQVVSLEVLLDNEGSAENVARTGRNMGCEVRLESSANDEFTVVLTRAGSSQIEDKNVADTCGPSSHVVVMIASSTFGEGDPELGRILMTGFIKTIKTVVPRPRTLVFLNSGIKLACEGSGLIEAIDELEQNGTKVLCCGTCLDFYNLKDSLKVGVVSNMFDIASVLVSADKVVRP